MDSVLQGIFKTQTGSNNLYVKLSAAANKETAGFILDNVGSADLAGEPCILDNSFQNSIGNTDARLIINLKNVNEEADANKLFCTINKTLANAGVYAGCFVNSFERKKKKGLEYKKQPQGFFKKYFKRKRFRSFSLAEVLGRLVYCGFEIVNYQDIGGLTWFIAKKKGEPQIGKNSSSGMIVKMERIGKGGKVIKIYKIRTMYPYSEYLQDYVVKNNGYNSIGKPNNDFRLLRHGRLIRKLYIDEIPQLINLLKGDINIIGVRPISRYGYRSMPADLQKDRIKYKPGLIPPQIALGMTGFQGVIEAEKIYLAEMKKRPFRTNFKYFFRAVFKILTFRVKSN
jgi:lipopolysaccharide/colanic/teichoic acid biosynthesis glycosyltransferase